MNGEPVYRRIADDLRQEITSGALAPGAPVPTGLALTRKYGVARDTAGKALRMLEHEGLTADGLVAHHDRVPVALGRTGHGWAGESPTAGADSWGAAVVAAGRAPSQRIEILLGAAGNELSYRLDVNTGCTVVLRRLIRYADNEPHNMISFWFPADVADGTRLEEPGSIAEGSIAWLEQKLGPLEHTWEATPRMPAPDEAEILRIPRGVPVLEVWRTSSAGGRPVAVSRAIYPGDRTKITG